ncbi:hypothetical protein [Pseudomonas aeruginosa]|uniref:hypothetical protein n=1 Tax=Pseudomonas aeruginosa TaxID=287 RepID=UPI000E00F99D|nr:hypothetical protein [Pseudomonas aeruginosa]SUC71574.1 Uncharacterised protein [Pseudomonas aeruginosa]
MNGKGRGNTLYAISLLLVGGCSSSLQHNEGATQVAHSPDNRAMSSIFLPSGRNSTTAIEKGEALSIKLIAAYLCDFREEKGNGDLLASGNKESSLCTGGDGSLFDNARSTQGEIAITASAGERGATSNGLSFNPADIKRNGRVVYYNEDIRESGQLINALNIPIYGPKTYDGGTFFVDLAILELDENENKQSRKLLQELAKVGSASYAPGTPVLNLLNSLGDAAAQRQRRRRRTSLPDGVRSAVPGTHAENGYAATQRDQHQQPGSLARGVLRLRENGAA